MANNANKRGHKPKHQQMQRSKLCQKRTGTSQRRGTMSNVKQRADPNPRTLFACTANALRVSRTLLMPSGCQRTSSVGNPP
eukprot:4942446-Amphidinium_carterae.1